MASSRVSLRRKNLCEYLVRGGIDIGLAVREKVNTMDPVERSERVASSLKSSGYGRKADEVGEKVGIEHLEKMSSSLRVPFELILDPSRNEVLRIGNLPGDKRILVYFDPVDGTSKVAGIDNSPEKGIIRSAGDGIWGVGIAFTFPTRKTLEKVTLSDFRTAVIVDGNPTMYKTHPQIVFTTSLDGKSLEARELSNGEVIPVFTSSGTDLSRSIVALEAFQGYDEKTCLLGDGRLAVKLFETLANRNSGGGFNLVGYNCAFAGVYKLLLGWRQSPTWIEPLGTVYLSINENLPNMVPVVPIVIEAGGVAVDLNGRALSERRLIDGRTSVLYAANSAIAKTVLGYVDRAKKELNLDRV